LKNGKINNIKLSMDNSYEFLFLSKDASYLLGNYNKEQFLLIRNCYHNLANMILNDTTNSDWRITGNPGIGKTFFCCYLLHRLAQQNKTVVYDCKDKFSILFDEDGAFYSKNGGYYRTDYYIVDDQIPRNYHSAKTILICSPYYRRYKHFDKKCPIINFMSVWSWEEINICRHVNFNHLCQEKVLELYKKWGGIPLFTLRA
jgi:hypothetical protein